MRYNKPAVQATDHFFERRYFLAESEHLLPWEYLVRNLDTLSILVKERMPEYPEEQEDILQSICLAYLQKTRLVQAQEKEVYVGEDTLLSFIAGEECRKKEETLKRNGQLFSSYSQRYARCREKEEDPGEQIMMQILLAELLDGLTEEERELFLLKEVIGWDYHTLSEGMRRSLPSLTCQIYRTKKKLKAIRTPSSFPNPNAI